MFSQPKREVVTVLDLASHFNKDKKSAGRLFERLYRGLVTYFNYKKSGTVVNFHYFAPILH